MALYCRNGVIVRAARTKWPSCNAMAGLIGLGAGPALSSASAVGSGDQGYKPLRVRTDEIGCAAASAISEGPSRAPIEWNSRIWTFRSDVEGDEAVALTGDQSLVEIGATSNTDHATCERFDWRSRAGTAVGMAAEGAMREVLAGKPLLAEGVGVSTPVERGLHQHIHKPIEILTNARESWNARSASCCSNGSMPWSWEFAA